MKNSLISAVKLRYVALFILISSWTSFGQVIVSNQVQYQLGNLPDYNPSNRSSLYNQLNLKYFSEKIGIGIRAEYFNSDEQIQHYGKIQQKFIRYQDNALEIQIGNFYETLGQGLLLRSYEVPGVIY